MLHSEQSFDIAKLLFIEIITRHGGMQFSKNDSQLVLFHENYYPSSITSLTSICPLIHWKEYCSSKFAALHLRKSPLKWLSEKIKEPWVTEPPNNYLLCCFWQFFQSSPKYPSLDATLLSARLPTIWSNSGSPQPC